MTDISRILENLQEQNKALIDVVSRNFDNSPNRKVQEYSQEDLIGLDDVCRMLRRKPSSIYRKTSNRSLPFIKPDGRLLFSRIAITRWMMVSK